MLSYHKIIKLWQVVLMIKVYVSGISINNNQLIDILHMIMLSKLYY